MTYSAIPALELFRRYFHQPSLETRNQLVQVNRGLVRQVAHHLDRQCAEPYEDLEQVGYLGLIRAIERFNPHQGTAFSSFAIPYIRGEILHYLRDKAGVLRIPRRWQELNSKGKNLRQQLELQLGRSPQEAEMAEALAVSLQEWQECQRIFQKHFVVSLDATLNTPTDYDFSLADTLPDYREQEKNIWEEERSQIQDAISQLETRTKAAIECVFFRDLPRKQAAKEIGISPMAVTRRLNKGLEQLGMLLQLQTA